MKAPVRSTRFCLTAIVALGVMCAIAPPVSAQVLSIFTTLDENCNSSVNGTPGADPCSLTTDPGPGGLSNVVTYNFGTPPSTFVTGDVVLNEATGGSSDLLRFWASATSGNVGVYFYSDTDGGVDALADIGLPTLENTNVVTLNEVSLPLGGFGAVYKPHSSQPGFAAGFDITYTFISDAPEPGSLALVGAGAAALLLLRRRRMAG